MNDPTQIIWAVGLIVAAIALSLWQRLDLESKILLATGRTLLQLIVVGFVLAVVFDPTAPSPILTFFVLAILLIISAIVTRNQISQKLPNLLPWLIGALFITTGLTVGYVRWLVIQATPWYEPRYLVPLVAIVLSHAMSAGAIAGERFVSSLNANTLEIETQLSLGASPKQAIAAYRKDAIRAGVLPTLNGMTIVGLATIPELLSGQLLGGANPVQATAFQILILLMLAFATLLMSILVTQGIDRHFFNANAQLM